MVHVDLDVSPHDNSKTKKEGVSRTYKGCDGYAPMHAYIGTPGYFINTELRTGSQHSQKGTPEFLRETIDLCRQVTDEPLLSVWIPVMMLQKTWAFSLKAAAFLT
jgi:hypothetical protein